MQVSNPKEICQMMNISICAFIERPLFGKY